MRIKIKILKNFRKHNIYQQNITCYEQVANNYIMFKDDIKKKSFKQENKSAKTCRTIKISKLDSQCCMCGE